MATKAKTPKIYYGELPPTDEQEGAFYKDLNTDILYEKVESEWRKKEIIPAIKQF